jgi:hypothetical protein
MVYIPVQLADKYGYDQEIDVEQALELIEDEFDIEIPSYMMKDMTLVEKEDFLSEKIEMLVGAEESGEFADDSDIYDEEDEFNEDEFDDNEFNGDSDYD